MPSTSITAAKFEEQNSLRHGEVLHCLAFKLGFFSHLPVPNSLIHLYASSDVLDSACQLFDEMPERDVVSYNSLLDGYVQSADFALADKLFWGSPFRNAVSFSTLFNGYVRNRMFDKGIEVFRAMQEEGIESEGCSIVSLLLVYSHFKWGLFRIQIQIRMSFFDLCILLFHHPPEETEVSHRGHGSGPTMDGSTPEPHFPSSPAIFSVLTFLFFFFFFFFFEI